MVRAKARFVAKSFSQIPGVEIMKRSVQRFSLPRKTRLGDRCPIRTSLFHFDAQKASVQSDVSEEVYKRLASGCGSAPGTKVRRRLIFYGLKRSLRQWNSLFVSTLQKYGIEQCAADPYVFQVMR